MKKRSKNTQALIYSKADNSFSPWVEAIWETMSAKSSNFCLIAAGS